MSLGAGLLKPWVPGRSTFLEIRVFFKPLNISIKIFHPLKILAEILNPLIFCQYILTPLNFNQKISAPLNFLVQILYPLILKNKHSAIYVKSKADLEL